GDYFVVDALGVGAGTAGELMRRGYPVVRYVGGAASADPSKWRNRRVQSYIALRNDLRDGYVVFDDNFCGTDEFDEFVAQLCSVRSRPAQERVEDLVTKEQMRREGIKSPDRADSLAMQYATTAPQFETRLSDAGRAFGGLAVPSQMFEGYLG
ncbi:MAG: hypothetical protein N3D71_01200, partial [Burkholderiaceae bacterium]|nr:hypothetical protein [Burkholderiaceae bacterium]